MIGEQIYLSGAFLAGLLSFFSPCIFPVLPVYIGILSGEINPESVEGQTGFKVRFQLMLKTMVFVAGLSVSFLILGFGAGALGSLIFRKEFFFIIGLLVVLLGIYQTGLVKIPILERQKKLEISRSRRNDLLGVFLLGFTFSFGWTPCIGPILGAILSVAASSGQAGYGGLLIFVYAFGLMLPFVVISLFSHVLLGRVRNLQKFMPMMRVLGGILIILMGLLLMFNQLNKIVAFFTFL